LFVKVQIPGEEALRIGLERPETALPGDSFLESIRLSIDNREADTNKNRIVAVMFYPHRSSSSALGTR
jgi:hypothetical protein